MSGPPPRAAESQRARLDLLIQDARLPNRSGAVTVGVSDGRIAHLDAVPPAAEADTVLDAQGGLVSPSFVDPHLHACKAHTVTAVGDEALRLYTGAGMSGASAAIRRAAIVKDRYRADWNAGNARRALLAGLRHGVTHVLAFADTDTTARLEGVIGVLRARDELRDVMTVRVVAFPQDGVLCDPGAEGMVREALELGADVVGGIPWIEAGEDEQRSHIDRMLALARAFDRDVAMLVDDAGDPSLRTTEQLARAAVDAGWEGRVVACHARALGAYPESYFRGLLPLLRDAGLRFVTDPHTGALFLRALDLIDAGVPVALGQDDIADAYYPYGQHSMLEVAFLASHLWRRFTFADMQLLVDLVTTAAAEVLGVAGHRLEVGAVADLVVLAQPTLHEALRRHEPPRFVVSAGRLVAESRSDTRFVGVPTALPLAEL